MSGATVTNARILVVDDEEANVRLLELILAHAGFAEVNATTDPRRVLHLYTTYHPDLVLLDLHMPHLDGFAVLEQLRGKTPPTSYLPVLVLTADIAREVKHRALSAGAKDFLTKPFDATEVLLRVRNLLETRFLHLELERQNVVLEERISERTADLWQAVQHLTESEKATREAVAETIRHLALAAELRDEETGRHIERMSRYAALLAGRMGLDPDRCELIRLASSMHDVGKIGVPDRILRKRGKFTTAEFEQMKRHPVIGRQVLGDSKAEVLQLAARIALTHHERFDGTGYPEGLAAIDIPLEGRIAAVADVFDALTSDRPYRKALPLGQALEIMKEGRARHFDPELVGPFLASMDDVLAIWHAYSDERITGSGAGRGRHPAPPSPSGPTV